MGSSISYYRLVTVQFTAANLWHNSGSYLYQGIGFPFESSHDSQFLIDNVRYLIVTTGVIALSWWRTYISYMSSGLFIITIIINARIKNLPQTR